MTKTSIVHDVPAADLPTVIADMKRDGFNVVSYSEPDGDFTVVGTKDVPDSNNPAPAVAKAAKSGK